MSNKSTNTTIPKYP